MRSKPPKAGRSESEAAQSPTDKPRDLSETPYLKFQLLSYNFSHTICKIKKNVICCFYMCKPLIKYRGGKSREIPHIEKHIPKFSGRYIEPFFGGGALYFYLEPKQAIINDINSKLMKFYDGVKNNYDSLRLELDEVEEIYEHNRKDFEDLKIKNPEIRVEDKNENFYYLIRNMYNNLTEKKYSDALIYFFINKTMYSGMIRYNAKGEFNVPYGRYPHLNTSIVTKAHSELLSQFEIR